MTVETQPRPPALPLRTDAVRQIELNRMKLLATGLLVAVALLFLGAVLLERRYPWVGFVRAFAEAAMVGALADWFAVTALFRHPLGLPIPHTAIIPHRKEALGRSLGDFVGENFLSTDVIRARLRAIGPAARLGGWLAEQTNAERVTTEVAGWARGIFTVLRDDEVQAALSHTVNRWLADAPLGPPAGRLLARFVEQ